MGKYFGTDGFRGEANVTLTVEHAYKVGRFIGWYYGQSPKQDKCKIIIGKDTRIHISQSSHARSSQSCDIHNAVRVKTLGIGDCICEDQSAFCIRIGYFNRFTGHQLYDIL